METTPQKAPSRVMRLKRALRKRWAQVCIVALVWLFALTWSVRHFAPKAPGKGDTSQYKFLHCDQCMQELPYNKDLEGKRCPKCQPPTTGFYVPSETSVKGGLGVSPWSKVYVATFVATVIMLAVLTLLMYWPVPDPKSVFYVVVCPYCNQRLRYRAVSHGGLGSCSRCKRMLRFPPEEEAVKEADVLRTDGQAALADAEAAARTEEADSQ